MAVVNFAPQDFRPFVTGEEGIDSPIRVGGYASSPYWNGALTAANNFNHLLAFSSKPVIQQYGSADLVYVATAITFAKYVIKIPSLMNRRVLRVEVTGSTLGGASFTPSATLTGGSQSGSGTGAATLSGGTSTINVSCPKTDDFQLLTLSFVMSAADTFRLTSVVAYSAPLAVSGGGADLGTLAAANVVVSGIYPYEGQPLYTPQATLNTPQYDANLPLTVAMMSDLTVGLQGMFRDNTSPLVNWSYWFNHATIATTDVGLRNDYDGLNTSLVPVAQYIYWPRQGVRKLKIFAAARQDVSGTGKLSSDWRGLTSVDSVNVATTTTNFAHGSWVIWGGDLAVPQSGGPVYLEIRGQAASTGSMYVQSFAAFEISEDGL